MTTRTHVLLCEINLNEITEIFRFTLLQFLNEVNIHASRYFVKRNICTLDYISKQVALVIL